MSYGKSLSQTMERYSGTVKQSRHIKRSGTGSVLTTEESAIVRRPVGFSPPRDPREYGEALWTAKDLL